MDAWKLDTASGVACIGPGGEAEGGPFERMVEAMMMEVKMAMMVEVETVMVEMKSVMKWDGKMYK